jgi:alpha,alpha-trehalase
MTQPHAPRLRALCALLAVFASLAAQARGTPAGDPATRHYIAETWSVLTRDNHRCETFRDDSTPGPPVVYVAADEDPGRVSAELAACQVQVRQLPAVIHRIGDLDPARVAPGLLYLPHPYVVPGGMFNEMYGWDSYFILRGLLADGKVALAQGMVENFFYEIEHYGGILNANRTIFLSRSQPPFLTSMIRELYAVRADRRWLARAYDAAVREYSLWVRPEHLAGTTGLARYWDYEAGPVPELGMNSPYFLQIAASAVRDPQLQDYLEAAPGPYELRVCAGTDNCSTPLPVGLSDSFFHGDRAVRESGFDITSRFGPFGGRAHDYAPVCLNSLLFKAEQDLEWMARQLGRSADATRWRIAADQRKERINRYLWNEAAGAYYDFQASSDRQSTYLFATTFYPLWAGIADPRQAAALRRNFTRLNRPGGLLTSETVSGAQWDAPYGWAPLQLLAAEGLARYGFASEAEALATEFTGMIDENLRRDGTIHEKYDVEQRTSEVHVTTGYTVNVAGFGWTNGVYLALAGMHARIRVRSESR